MVLSWKRSGCHDPQPCFGVKTQKFQENGAVPVPSMGRHGVSPRHGNFLDEPKHSDMELRSDDSLIFVVFICFLFCSAVLVLLFGGK